MRRSDRLFQLLNLLRHGDVRTAQALAEALNVSVRTIYRDMETLQASGVPIEGSRGVGYRATGMTTLPPIALTAAELEALNLGIAIVAQAGDQRLAQAAATLGDKVDAALPETAISEAEAWKFATYPFADAARGLSHMSALRAAIKARQKLVLEVRRPDASLSTRTVWPLHLEYWGRVWILTTWCELQNAFREFRVDLIETATPQPALFEHTPGKTFADYKNSL